MRFMDVRPLTIAGAECVVSRSGYTGEDGYELSVPAGKAEAVAEALVKRFERCAFQVVVIGQAMPPVIASTITIVLAGSS
jgi:glycine cleavage system aminomethyltransferase T